MAEETEAKKMYVEEISRVAKGAGIVFSGTVIGGGVSYVYHIFLARVLGPSSYGFYALGLAVFNVASILSLMGMHYGLLRYVALYHGEKDQPRLKGTILSALISVTLVGVLLGGLLFILSDFISINMFQKEDLAIVLKLFGIAIPFFGLMSVFVFSTQGFQIMKYRVYIRNIWEPVGKICIATIFFAFGLRLIGAVTSHVLTLVIGSVFAYYCLKNLFPLKKTSIQPIFETTRLLKFALPLFVVSALQIGRNRTDRLLLGYFHSPHEVGLYTAAFQTSILIMMVLTSFNTIFTPMISDLYNRKEYQKLESLLKTVAKWTATLSLPIFIILFFHSGEILGLFGRQFIHASMCLKILLLGQIVNSGTGSVGSVLTMSGRPKIELFNNMVVFVLEIPLCILLIPEFGIAGAAIAFAGVFSMLNILRVVEVYAILKIHPYRVDFVKPIAAGCLLSLFLFFLRGFSLIETGSFVGLILCIFISLAFYFTLIFLFGLGQEDVFVLNKLKEKLIRMSRKGNSESMEDSSG